MFAAPAQAQSVTTFVSNLNQGYHTEFSVFSNESRGGHGKGAQLFTTGRGTFALSSVVVSSRDPEGDKFSVSVCKVKYGLPSTTCTPAFTAPSSFARGDLSFTAPSNTVLAGNTRYAVVFEPTGNTVDFRTTRSSGEDSGAATGWSIRNDALRFFEREAYDSFYYFWTGTQSPNTFRIAIKGNVTTEPLSGLATLTGLTLTDRDGKDIPISPAFSPTTKNYSASMEFDSRDVTIEGIPSDSRANVGYLDSNGTEFWDEDPTKDGFQYTFPVGTNSFTVRVTSYNGVTTDRSFTLSATRDQGTVCAKPAITPGRTEVWSGTLKPGEVSPVNVRLTLTWIAGESPAGGKV